MGVKLRVLDPTPACPAAAAAAHTLGSFTDAADVAAFAASGVGILTVEIEHVDADALAAAAVDAGVDVEPTPGTVRLIQVGVRGASAEGVERRGRALARRPFRHPLSSPQDKCAQKEHFARAGVPVPPFAPTRDAAAAAAFGAAHGYPFMLKARRGAYDGRGNAVVADAASLPAAAESLGGYAAGGALYAEAWCPFVRELAVMVARARDGSTRAFPVTRTLHRDSVLWVTETPAAVPPAVAAAAEAVAAAAVASLDGAGVFGVELFELGEEGGAGARAPTPRVLLNEVAPRPHNSGHYTIEGATVSQFEQHLRAVLGWPLGDVGMVAGSAIMLNILGTASGPPGVAAAHAVMAAAYATPGASVHWYGKDGVAPGRKVGHVTVVGATRAEARARLAAIDPAAAAALAEGEEESTGARVGIIMGSDSDLPTMAAAADALAAFGIPVEVTVVSAHRTPDRMVSYARSAADRGIEVIVAGAGGAAHLPGMVAALTPLPVVGVPVVPAGARLDGLDALLSIVQMPRGVPVATVGVGNAANAGLLAARILASRDPALRARIEAWQAEQRDVVLEKAAKLEAGGWQAYLGGR